MVVVLIVLVSFCVINRWWWWWRGRVLARRRAAALQEERNREAEMISSNTLPEDAITVAVRQLPEISWDTNTVATMADSEESECRLCLEDYRVGEKVRKLPCGHCYHSTCIDVWLAGYRLQGLPRGERTCPLCKQDPLAANIEVQRHLSGITAPPEITFGDALCQFFLTGDVHGRVVFRRRRPGRTNSVPTPTRRSRSSERRPRVGIAHTGGISTTPNPPLSTASAGPTTGAPEAPIAATVVDVTPSPVQEVAVVPTVGQTFATPVQTQSSTDEPVEAETRTFIPYDESPADAHPR